MTAPSPVAQIALAALAASWSPRFVSYLFGYHYAPSATLIAHELARELKRSHCLPVSDSDESCAPCEECSCPVTLAPTALWVLLLVVGLFLLIAAYFVIRVTCCITKGRPYKPLADKGKGSGKGRLVIVQ